MSKSGSVSRFEAKSKSKSKIQTKIQLSLKDFLNVHFFLIETNVFRDFECTLVVPPLLTSSNTDYLKLKPILQKCVLGVFTKMEGPLHFRDAHSLAFMMVEDGGLRIAIQKMETGEHHVCHAKV